MKKITFSKIIQILFYTFVFCYLLAHSYSYLDPDLGWHLKVGEQIINEKAVPSYEYYDWTLEGKKWVDHEWLINVTTFWLYKNFGYLMVNIFFALIILLTLILLNIFTQKYFLKEKNGLFFILFFQTLGLVAMAPHLGVRMQEITVLNLLLLLIIIYHYEKNKNFKILFWLLPLFYFWACLHPGFLIGIFIMFFWLGVKLIKPLSFFRKRARGKLLIQIRDNLQIIRNNSRLIFFSFIFLSILATFFTPYGFKLYEFLFGYNSAFYLTHIQEWLPFFSFPILYWQLLYTAFVAVVIILSIIDVIKKPVPDWSPSGREKKLILWDLLISLFFIILAFKSKRHFPLLFIVSFPMVVKFFIDSFNFKEIFKKFTPLEKVVDSSIPLLAQNNKKQTSLMGFSQQLFLVKPYLIIAFLLIIVSQFLKINFTSDPFLSFKNDYPQKAVIFLKNNPQYDNLKFFNPYSWGGYLIWTLPERKLFIDGRLPQYSFKNHTFLEEYYEFFDKEKVKKKLNEYNIKLVLLNIKEKKYKFNWFEKYFLGFDEDEINKNANENHLRDYLNNSNKWEKIYNDKISAVYVKDRELQNVK
ncbi:hypothetical protein HY750_01490 [Candidatus Kuenenbacteria bacterium]|nr:hypothetical protein [Candidatus Kuenenbacteria bacterium]